MWQTFLSVRYVDSCLNPLFIAQTSCVECCSKYTSSFMDSRQVKFSRIFHLIYASIQLNKRLQFISTPPVWQNCTVILLDLFLRCSYIPFALSAHLKNSICQKKGVGLEMH